MASQEADHDLRKGPWLQEEDEKLTAIVSLLGGRRWDALAKTSGLRRSGKSCRLRWMNYLRPNLKHGNISEEEEQIILHLHKLWGNKWSRIARKLPGRTDNEIKNYWRSHLSKKVEAQQEENSGDVTNFDMVAECNSNGDASGTSVDSDAAILDLSNVGVMNSPYEIRISNWMSHCRSNHQGNCCELGTSFTYSGWMSNGTWDYSSSLWNMDYYDGFQ